MLLDTTESIREIGQELDLKASELTAFFADHDVSPFGVLEYADRMSRSLLDTEPDVTDTLLKALFAGGVTLGLHLADLRTAQLRQPLLRALAGDRLEIKGDIRPIGSDLEADSRDVPLRRIDPDRPS